MTVDHSEHFSRAELECPCGCGRCEMDAVFLTQLETVRLLYGKPIHVTSGYRCPDYNERISHTGRTGPHTKGCAVDIHVYGQDAHALLAAALSAGMRGIGVKQHGPYEGRFIHLDTDDNDHRPWVWTYD